MTTPASPSPDEVILDLPAIDAFSERSIITRNRLTFGSNTISLAGVTGVNVEIVKLHQWPAIFWSGWALLAAGIFIPYCFPAVMIFGGIMVWMARKDGNETARIILEQNGRRKICYQQDIGHWDEDFWAKNGRPVGSEQNKERVAYYHRHKERADQIAEAIGKAIGMQQPPLPQFMSKRR